MKYYMTTKSNNLWSPFNMIDDLFTTPTRGMHTDIAESDKEYTMSIELAGYNKDNIKLDYDNGYMTVSATKDKSEHKYITRESKSSVSRSYYVGELDIDTIKATYVNGVLEVVIPKQAEVKKNTSILIA